MTKQEKWDYIKEHYGREKTLQEIANYTGYCTDNVMAIARRLREQGFDIPNYRKSEPIGTITQRKLKDYYYSFMKTESGWVRLKKDPKDHIRGKSGRKPKAVIACKPSKTKPPREKRKPNYESQGPVKIKKDDLVNNQYVKRDAKTYVLKPKNISV